MLFAVSNGYVGLSNEFELEIKTKRHVNVKIEPITRCRDVKIKCKESYIMRVSLRDCNVRSKTEGEACG